MTQTEPTDGLITAHILDRKGSSMEIGWEGIRTWQPSQGILWVHLDFTKKEAKKWLQEESGIDRVTVNSMTVPSPRSRSIVSEKSILIFLRGVNLNPGEDPDDMVSTRVWLEENRIITTRHRKLLSIMDIREMLKENSGPKSTIEFLNFLIERLNVRIEEVINRISERVDLLEEQILVDAKYEHRNKILELRQAVINLRRFLAPQREAINQIITIHPEKYSVDQRALFREAVDRVIRTLEELDSLRERSTVLQEEVTGKIAAQMNQRMYVLSIVTIIFLPLSFVTGLFGINVGGIPGQNYTMAFPIVTIILLALGLGILVYLHVKKWI